MLELEEAGVMTAISAPYLDSSRCAYLEAYEEDNSASQNLTLIDMGGVFLVLGVFVALSIALWTCRHSPPARKMRKWSHARLGVRKFEKVL